MVTVFAVYLSDQVICTTSTYAAAAMATIHATKQYITAYHQCTYIQQPDRLYEEKNKSNSNNKQAIIENSCRQYRQHK